MLVWEHTMTCHAMQRQAVLKIIDYLLYCSTEYLQMLPVWDQDIIYLVPGTDYPTTAVYAYPDAPCRTVLLAVCHSA